MPGIRHSLSTKLIATLLVCLLLPMMGLGLFYAYRLRDILMHNEQRSVSQSVETSLGQLDQLVEEMIGAISSLAISHQVNELLKSDLPLPSYGWFQEYRTFENLLETVAAKGNRRFSVTAISRGGKVYRSGALHNSLLRLDDPLVQRILASRNTTLILNRELEGLDNSDMLTAGKAFYERGQLLGVVLVDVPLPTVASLLAPLEQGGLQVYVLADSGALLYANADSSGVASPEALQQALATGSESILVDGLDYLVISSRSANSGLSMLAMVPKAAVFAESNQLFLQMMASFGGVLLLAIVVIVLIAAGTSRQLRLLNRAVSRFGETGQEIMLAPRSRDEVGQLTAGAVAMSQRIVRLLAQIREDEHTKWQLEFRALQSQINPHMIYNTLNTITYLAQLQNVANIEEVSSSFAHLLRMVASRQSEYISIEEELACVQAFVAIKQYNLPWDIAYEVDADPAALPCRVLKLLLQPFVENAIVHGFSGRNASGTVRVKVALADGLIHIDITDDGAGMDPETLARVLNQPVTNSSSFSSVGVYNTLQRLRLTYGEAATCAITSQVNQGTHVHISYPAQPPAPEKEAI